MRIENSPGAYGFLAGAFVMLLGLLANASCVHDAQLSAPAITRSYDAALEITASCSEPDGTLSGWHGTGVVIDETRLLTAGHVAETDPGEVCAFTAEDAAGKTYLVYPLVVLSSSTIDLATMQIISPSQKFHAERVRFGAPPVSGEIVCAATAYPRREHKCGRVMKLQEPPGDIRVDMVVEPGNSGSALYNMRHELVGIVVHTYQNRSNGQYITGGASSLDGYRKELKL